MPEDLSEEDRVLEAKVHVCKAKCVAFKKGLTKEKNAKAARKKEYMSQTLQLPEDLIQFLQAEEMWVRILEVAEQHVRDIHVRRYGSIADNYQLRRGL